MTNQQHPITPPPELAKQWLEELYNGPVSVISPFDQRVLIAVAQWGAAQELEACCEWLEDQLCMPPKARADAIAKLRVARRQRPSLKEQALETLKYPKDLWSEAEVDTIRRALGALPE